MENIKIDYFDHFPKGFTGIKAEQIRSVFPNPSLIKIKGQKNETLFVSLLLHGNETTSFYVGQKIAEYCEHKTPNKNIYIFIGNVQACEKNERYLEGQEDYNRIWAGGKSPEHLMAKEVLEQIDASHDVFACVDIHNNTGTNPLYACISKLDQKDIYLARLFSRTMVYFENPSTALSLVLSKRYASITLECGKSDTQEGVNKAFQFILDALNLNRLEHRTSRSEVDIYQTVCRIVVKPGISFSFQENNQDTDVVFADDFESLNFSTLEVGRVLALCKTPEPPFKALDEGNQDCFDEFFVLKEKRIELKKRVVPSMFTKNKDVIMQDCLGYLMEPLTAEI